MTHSGFFPCGATDQPQTNRGHVDGCWESPRDGHQPPPGTLSAHRSGLEFSSHCPTSGRRRGLGSCSERCQPSRSGTIQAATQQALQNPRVGGFFFPSTSMFFRVCTTLFEASRRPGGISKHHRQRIRSSRACRTVEVDSRSSVAIMSTKTIEAAGGGYPDRSCLSTTRRLGLEQASMQIGGFLSRDPFPQHPARRLLRHQRTHRARSCSMAPCRPAVRTTSPQARWAATALPGRGQ